MSEALKELFEFDRIGENELEGLTSGEAYDKIMELQNRIDEIQTYVEALVEECEAAEKTIDDVYAALEGRY